jgi:alkylation response protein AidB-like acyl-CoA dehydrogenase
MKSIYFSTQHEEFRMLVREFIDKNILPYANEWEKQRYVSRDVWLKMGAIGLLGLMYPKEYGGQAKDIFYSIILLEELGRTGYAGFRVAIAVHAYMGISYISRFGSNDLCDRYLSQAISGNKICALAMTEEHAGSDLSNLRTNATLNNNIFTLNGTKKYVANGSLADFIIVAVKTDDRHHMHSHNISLLVVDVNLPGVKINRLDHYNWHSSDLCEVTFENVQIPVENLIGSKNSGFIYIMQNMQLERLVAGVLAIGGADSCLDHTWQYISKREAFGNKISKFQAVRHVLANLVSELESIRLLSYHTAWLFENDELPIAQASMLKLTATELALKIAIECIHLYGAHGGNSNSSIARMYRDAQSATVAAGTSEVMRDIIAQITFDETGWRRKINCESY